MAYHHKRNADCKRPGLQVNIPRIVFGIFALLHYTARVVSAKARRARKKAKRSLKQVRRKLLRPLLLLPARRISKRRVRIALITGTKGKTTTTRMLAHILSEAGHVVGYSSTDGVFIAGEQASDRDSTGYAGAARVLKSPSITVAVLETARGGLLSDGLYVDRCDVAALLNVGRDHIGIDGIKTLEQMAKLKRRVIEAARKTVVLNADDPRCRNLIDAFPASRTTVFSLKSRSRTVKQHLANGGVAFSLEDNEESRIVRREGGTIRPVVSITNLPAAWGGVVRHNIANAMAALALAEGLGIASDKAGVALSSFAISVEKAHGRFNVIGEDPNLVIVDRAVNPPAAKALVASLRNIDKNGRRICMLTSVGNRPQAHFTEFGRLLAQGFDQFVCYERERYLRGRAPGEIAELLRRGLEHAGVKAKYVDVASDHNGALRRISQLSTPGDILVIIGQFTRDEIMQMQSFFASQARLTRSRSGRGAL